MEEELRRVVPVLRSLCRQTHVPVSIDTSKAQVAQSALDCGAEIINDVTGLEGDPEMVGLALRSGAGVCAMHMHGTPATMQDDPVYDDVVEEVAAYLAARRDCAGRGGCGSVADLPGSGDRVRQDAPAQPAAAGAAAIACTALGCPLMVGHSRKGFIAHVLGDKHGDRTAGTIGVALALAAQGVQVLRVHDVRPVRQALLLYAAATCGELPDWSLGGAIPIDARRRLQDTPPREMGLLALPGCVPGAEPRRTRHSPAATGNR